jgi:transposase
MNLFFNEEFMTNEMIAKYRISENNVLSEKILDRIYERIERKRK